MLAPFSLIAWLIITTIKVVLWFVASVYSVIKEQIYFSRTRSCIHKFSNTLLLRKSQLVLVDQFGTNTAEWEKEKLLFIKRFLLPCPAKVSVPKLSKIIDKQLKRHAKRQIALSTIKSPIDYEAYCAGLLKESGWTAIRTPPTGDQGIDIVATKDGVTAVFQCKWYSQPVGNKAVQEVIAGKLFQEAELAVVLSNSTFTPSAQHLANRTGVHLLHHSQIENFTDRLGALAQTTVS